LVALAVHAALLRLLHPFVPFITEELWHQHPQVAGFCMKAPMPRTRAEAPFAAAAAQFELARELVQTARNLRNEMGVEPGKRGTLVLAAPKARRADLAAIGASVELLAKLISVQVLADGEAPPQRAARAVVQDIELHLPMSGLIDAGKERARLGKERDGLAQHYEQLRRKLENESFLARAPADVVERERRRAEELQATLQRLAAQIEQLG
jgi:valyl-tRNA synthetase